jgi:hypothetical protein
MCRRCNYSSRAGLSHPPYDCLRTPRGLYSPYAAWKPGILGDPYGGSCLVARGKAGTRSFATGEPTTRHRARLVLGLLCPHYVPCAQVEFPGLLNTPSLTPNYTGLSVTRLDRTTRSWLIYKGETERQQKDLFAKAGSLSIYRSSRRHNSTVTVLENEEPVARYEGAKRRVPSRKPSRRKADKSRGPR